jgi:hypothetical protein
VSPAPAVPLRVPSFVVIGGGEAGVFYVRQLRRAAAAGRLSTERLVVVDRDPACAVARAGIRAAPGAPRVELAPAEWSAWLAAHLGGLGPDDQLVPYHWAPHLLVEWLAHEARARGARAQRGGPLPMAGTPFERSTRTGDQALSYATWTCPATCIEPTQCPHTRGPKDWSLVARLARPDPDEALDGRLVLPSLHLVYGVATIPIAAIHAARDRVLADLARGPRQWLVATASHCHGLATRLAVG